MIRHTVLFHLNKTATLNEIDLAFKQLARLQQVLPGFLRFASGECTFHHARDNNIRLYGFSIDFNDEDAYNEFLNNPVTNPAKEALLQIIEGGVNGLYGYDMGKSQTPSPTLDPFHKHRILSPRLVPRGL